MSYNQSRGDRSDSSQYRKHGQSGSFSQKNSGYFGSSGKGGAVAAPPPASNLPPSRSFSKKSNNAQGGQSGASSYGGNLNSGSYSSAVHRTEPNGSHFRPQLPASNAQVGSIVKPAIEQPSQASAQVVPKPQSQASNVKPDPASHATPTKAPGDASKSFPIQFGSVSPGTLNGMQIPARTSSAPPNLVEQQRDQARRDLPRQQPPAPIPAIPKQQTPRKDGSAGDQPKASEPHQLPKVRRDTQVSAPAPITQTQKAPVHNISGISMPMQFHHQHHQVPAQFGGPTPQMQPQGMPGNSLPMPMPLPLPSPSSVYFSGLHHHPHPLQAQGMIHQGQGLNFPAQLGPQMPPQLANMGMGPGLKLPQLQPSKSRTPVKITYPDTGEELRLENAAGLRSHQSVPQTQPVPSTHPINYHPNPAFFSPQGPVALNGAMNPSSQQPPRFGFPVSQGQQTASFANPSHKPPILDKAHDGQKAVSSAAATSVQVTIKPATGMHGQKMNDVASSTTSVEKGLSEKLGEAGSTHSQRDSDVRPNSSSSQAKPFPSVSSVSVKEPAPIVSHSTSELTKKETITKVDCIKDQGKKQNMKGSSQPSRQVSGQSSPVSNLPSQSLEHTNSFSSGTVDTSAIKTTASSSSVGSGIESTREPPTTKKATVDVLGAKQNDDDNSKTPLESALSKVPEVVNQIEIKSSAATQISSHEVKSLKVVKKGTVDPLNSCKNDNREVSSAPLVPDVGKSVSIVAPLPHSAGDLNISTPEFAVGVSESLDSVPAAVAKSVVSDEGAAPLSINSQPELTLKLEKAAASPREKPVVELSRPTSSGLKGKKRLKGFLQKADAAGTTSDMYNAYKGPEEKKETLAVSERDVTKEVVVDSIQDNVESIENRDQSKVEPDDWEDAAEVSPPKLEIAENANKVSVNCEHGSMEKTYSRDFLLTFSEKCIDLPEVFEITSDLAEALMSSNVSREPYPSPGRIVDRSPGGPHRAVVVGDEDRWKQKPSPLVSGHDLRTDGHGGNFRLGLVGNHGPIRNARGQAPSQFSGGILSGPMQSMGPQVGYQRSNSDADRWQRATNFQKGLIPSPHTPAPVMHKAENKYQVGKITDEEQAKQRQLKGILNKLTPQNFEKLFEQVKAVNIDNAGTLSAVISQIFDKALMEPTFCEMYANFCYHLAGELPGFNEDNEKITFKRLLLNKCQEEFERGEREQEEADKADAEGEVKQSPEVREEKRVQARRRMLGNIRLIGELYKKKMLTERIMHECIKKLLGQYQNPDEEDIESLCKLMSTIGEMIDHSKAKEHMDAYFDMILRLSNNMKISSRVRFMLKDTIDLRKNRWQQRRKVEGPKKIEEVHRDAAQERSQAGRQSRGPGPNSSVRNRQVMDFGSRGSNTLPSPNSQMGGYRGLQSQPRGFGVPDPRIDDRHHFESRPLSMQRSLGEEPLMLGPQGGLGRGMSIRGQPIIANTPLAEQHSSGDPRRMGSGLNGFGSVPDRSAYGSREDLMPRYNNMPERSPGPHDQGAILDRNMSFGNRGSRSRPSSPNVGIGGHVPTQNVSSEKELPEERLREKSLSTIKEFYSAKDEKEVALCVKELNAPSFYPTMISLWISDSFERKDMERASLAKLLTNLSKSQYLLINRDHLLKGFESVLSTLEDAVNDAPNAGEFLGRILAKVIIEDVIPFSEIGQIIYKGGEEPGSLVEFGLAAEVIGTILEIIKSEKGESFLNEICTSPGLKLERFRPQNSKKPLRIDKFI